MRTRLAMAVVLGFALRASVARAQQSPTAPTLVTPQGDLERALRAAKPGTHLRLAPGNYAKAFAGKVIGTPEQPVIVEAADPDHPPVFNNQKYGMHISKCAHLVLRNIVFRTTQGNGLNIDDGDDAEDPSHHVVLENLSFADIGPQGNNDGIKLSGVTDFTVRNCRVEGWGGSGIDLVGCHRGLVEGCTFRGKEGMSQASGVQIKGGSSAVTVRGCTFVNAGQRAVNVGGNTDRNVFRPREANYESKDVTVEGCRFAGSDAPVSFVGSDGGVVRYNTIYSPTKWALRILQENGHGRMVPCQGGRFENNLVVFEAATLRRVINVGDNTKPETFTFARNVWYARDNPTASKPNLPSPEKDGAYGTNPGVSVSAEGVPSAPRAGPTATAGADALPHAGPAAGAGG